jgi:hypothetical protein
LIEESDERGLAEEDADIVERDLKSGKYKAYSKYQKKQKNYQEKKKPACELLTILYAFATLACLARDARIIQPNTLIACSYWYYIATPVSSAECTCGVLDAMLNLSMHRDLAQLVVRHSCIAVRCAVLLTDHVSLIVSLHLRNTHHNSQATASGDGRVTVATSQNTTRDTGTTLHKSTSTRQSTRTLTTSTTTHHKSTSTHQSTKTHTTSTTTHHQSTSILQNTSTPRPRQLQRSTGIMLLPLRSLGLLLLSMSTLHQRQHQSHGTQRYVYQLGAATCVCFCVCALARVLSPLHPAVVSKMQCKYTCIAHTLHTSHIRFSPFVLLVPPLRH